MSRAGDVWHNLVTETLCSSNGDRAVAAEGVPLGITMSFWRGRRHSNDDGQRYLACATLCCYCLPILRNPTERVSYAECFVCR